MFDPSEFAALAADLTDDGKYDKEARTRAALSRAYYALFLSVRSALRTAQGAPTHGRDDRIAHGNLPIALYASNDPGLNAVAKTLEELYRARRTADYELVPDANGAVLCSKPARAQRLARRAEAAIRQLPNLDFSKVAGRFEVAPPRP